MTRYTVTGLERIEGHGRLFALVALEIDFDGVPLALQGVQVVRRGKAIASPSLPLRKPQERRRDARGDPAEELGARSRRS